MPRIYDFSHDGTRSDKAYIWSVFREQPRGRGEITEVDLWGPGGILVMDGPRHQFDLRPPEGTPSYDNDLVDPIFKWLDANTVGPWHWLEGLTNNDRNVYTSVYLRDAADIDAFREAYGDLFKYDENQTVENADWAEKESQAQDSNTLPWYVTPSFMETVVMTVDADTSEWFENLMGREGFDDVFADGLTQAVEALMQAEPRDEWGARFKDGTWHPNVLKALGALGTWIREKASPSLIQRLEGFTVDDPVLKEALGPISAVTTNEVRP